MASCNLHHLYYWLMRSRAESLTVGFLPGSLFWSLCQNDLPFFLAAILQSAKEVLSSSHQCLPCSGLSNTCQQVPKIFPFWCRGANMSLCANKYVQGLSQMVAGLHLKMKDFSLRSKGNYLDPRISEFMFVGKKNIQSPNNELYWC